jgi:hypothetical protein
MSLHFIRKVVDVEDELRRMAQTHVEAIEPQAITKIEPSCLEAVGKACRLMWRLVWRPRLHLSV